MSERGPGEPPCAGPVAPLCGHRPQQLWCPSRVHIAWAGPEVLSVWNTAQRKNKASEQGCVGRLAHCWFPAVVWGPQALLSGPCIAVQPTGHSRLLAVFCSPWPDSGLGFWGLPAWVALPAAFPQWVCALCWGVGLSPSAGKPSFSLSEHSRALEFVTCSPLGDFGMGFQCVSCCINRVSGEGGGHSPPFPPDTCRLDG